MKKKTKTNNAASPFFHFENIGDSIKGRFQFFEETFGLKNGAHGMAIRLIEGKLIGLSGDLQQKFAPVHDKMKSGDRLEITFVAQKKRFKVFDVRLNGKVLQSAGFNKPAEKSYAKSFFSNLNNGKE